MAVYSILSLDERSLMTPSEFMLGAAHKGNLNLCKNERSLTPIDGMLEAAKNGNLNLFKKLAKELDEKDDLAGTITSSKNDYGRMALHSAAVGGATQILKYLVDELKLDVNIKDGGETPLHCAIKGKHLRTARYLLDKGANLHAQNDEGYTALHLAALEGHKKLLQLLISKGAEVDTNTLGGRPLQCAAAKGHKDCVKILLDKHANPNDSSFHKLQPLMLSIENGSVECVKLLLEAGADPNDNSRKFIPLHLAVRKGGIPILKCLLNAGANPNLTNHSGLTAIEVAAVRQNHDAVMTLFPVTSPISDFPDWSVAGIMVHVHTEEMIEKRKQKMHQNFLQLKSKGAEAVENKDFTDAIKWYSKAFGCDVDNNDAAAVFSNLSFCWARLNEGRYALRDANMSMLLRPYWGKAYYRVGVAYMLLKQYEYAAEAFNDALKFDRNNKEIKRAFREAVDAQRANMVD